MEVNSKHGHHLPCLSGLSQAPLIPSTNDNGSERSTPISAHSLPFASPNKLRRQGLGTPLPMMPVAFFPPPPSTRSNQFATTSNGKPPKGALDVNMNAESERNREVSSSNVSPSHLKFSSSTNPSRLNSPLNQPIGSKQFLESPHSFNQQQQARRQINLSPTLERYIGDAQQDENYHLYHEPIDPEELNSSQQQSETNQKLSTPTSPDHLKNCPPPLFARSNLATTDWSFVVPGTPTNKSPTVVGSDFANDSKDRPNLSPFTERAGSNRRNDVSADIYLCYVSLKSNERDNHRSRSYHGPKNTGLHSQAAQHMPYARDATKNLSSTSIAELPISPAAFASTMIPIHFRDHCVRELIETESNYVHALEMIITCFAKPLEPLLKRDENQLIFKHIEYFYRIHSSFQADLVKAALKSYNKDLASLSSPTHNALSNNLQGNIHINSNPSTPTTASNNIARQFLKVSPLSSPTVPDLPKSPTNKNANGGSCKISSCFLSIKDKFLKYGEYCATLSKAQALLDELANKNEAIATQLDRCQQDANEGKFKLRDLLSLPMQRILKYHLLLAQLIKTTSTDNEDFSNLKKAHESMVNLGQYINEVKRDTEAMQIINDIEQSIAGLNMPPNTQLTDYGRLVTDGSIRIKVPCDMRTKPTHETKIKQKRYVFVFDKVMLLCKVSGVRGYQFKEALILSEYAIDKTTTVAQNAAEKWKFHFNLVRVSDRTTYSFYAKTLEAKNRWIVAIERAMDNIRPAVCRNNETNHEFLMHTFEKASSCDHCGKLLLGLYYQGYRCRTCFTSAHKKCLASIRPCGPILPPRPGNTLTSPRTRCKEPPSPSIRSICSDDGQNVFMHFPSSNSSSTQCIESATRNEYSNIDNRIEPLVSQLSSFRENGSRNTFASQRPGSSMINVSQQNSTNHLLQQRRLLKGSNSTPTISQRASLKAIALSNYEGNETGHLQVQQNDLIMVYKSSVKQTQIFKTSVDHSMAQLRLNPSDPGDTVTEDVSWWFGKNMRTCKEGQFPSNIVEILDDQNGIQVENENSVRDLGSRDNDLMNSTPGKRCSNFILNDFPWFCGRMERDKAQSLLENTCNGTFLVRVSPKHNGSYVISLNYNSHVKHMRIYVSKDNQLYLSQNRYFKSVIELVAWYEKNSLVESFHMLDARLSIPYESRDIKV